MVIPINLDIEADVLVIGGGLSGAWSAIAAAQQGASVVLVDKGYCGTSGVTATAGPGHWWVDPDHRDEAIRVQSSRSGGLADPGWMARVLDTTWRILPTLASYYPFPVDDQGITQYRALRGPEYLRALRQMAEDLGVRILDHSPALELLLHRDGSVAGARGIRRQAGGGSWCVRAGAVILATGGCAFMSRLLGSQTNTGDGYLMAVEAGAELSGMEFSNYYTVAPIYSTQTRSASYVFATYFDSDGAELDIDWGDGNRSLAKALLAGRVFCNLARMPQDLRDRLSQIQPAVLLSFARQGIDPFTDKFEVTLRGEGTVRGSGGIRIIDENCQTSVPGLFAVGDAATRELIAGAISGGGAQNSAWALTSGYFAGRGAARLVRGSGRRVHEEGIAIGKAGIHPAHSVMALDTRAIIAGVQQEMEPFDKNIFRSGVGLRGSLTRLDALWQDVRNHLYAEGVDLIKARESAALVATARWCYTAAFTRQESRGMHIRDDAPMPDPRFTHRLLVGGLDQVWTQLDEGSEPESIASEAA
ncbi:MAG: FAD-binding protein [Cyanobacteriota bacterium]|nr:FAD-binding protein [Cyanobacteriota bacterium]